MMCFLRPARPNENHSAVFYIERHFHLAGSSARKRGRGSPVLDRRGTPRANPLVLPLRLSRRLLDDASADAARCGRPRGMRVARTKRKEVEDARRRRIGWSRSILLRFLLPRSGVTLMADPHAWNSSNPADRKRRPVALAEDRSGGAAHSERTTTGCWLPR